MDRFFFFSQINIEVNRKRLLQVQGKTKAKWESLFVIRECNVTMELKIRLEKVSWRQIVDAFECWRVMLIHSSVGSH